MQKSSLSIGFDKNLVERIKKVGEIIGEQDLCRIVEYCVSLAEEKHNGHNERKTQSIDKQILIRFLMMRFRLTREQVESAYIERAKYISKRHYSVEDEEKSVFGWFFRGYGKTRNNRVPLHDCRNLGYIARIIEIGLDYEIAEAYRVRFGLTVEDINNVAEALHNRAANWEKNKAEFSLYEECKKINQNKKDVQGNQYVEKANEQLALYDSLPSSSHLPLDVYRTPFDTSNSPF